MSDAKRIVVKPISQADAARVIRAFHYSGGVVQNSQLHFGVFLDGRCGGAMQFGPSMDKRRTVGLVRDTAWNGFLELNRMAFADWLPRNSESRALAVAMKIIRKNYPHIEWVISFADGAQCGDGTIYRASGFVLTGIKPNTQIIEFPDGFRCTRLALTIAGGAKRAEVARRYGAKLGGGASLQPFVDVGARAVPGFQLRYVYFLNPAARARLTVPEIPFSEIARRGARMYRGQRVDAGGVAEVGSSTPAGAVQTDTSPSVHGGATPTRPLSPPPVTP